MLSDKLNYKHNGHTYHLVKVEGAERYSVIRDGRETRQISMACLVTPSHTKTTSK